MLLTVSLNGIERINKSRRDESFATVIPTYTYGKTKWYRYDFY